MNETLKLVKTDVNKSDPKSTPGVSSGSDPETLTDRRRAQRRVCNMWD